MNIADTDGMTPFLWAAYCGNLDVINYLTKKGESLDNTENYYGMNALLLSSKMGHLEIVEFLWDRCSDTNTVDQRGFNALIHAVRNNHLEIVKFLTA